LAANSKLKISSINLFYNLLTVTEFKQRKGFCYFSVV